MDRQANLDFLRQHPQVDVLVIGGGVNGIGTFRDLALQGVDVLLADRADFCSGASAASSHMVHGGVRYLENGEFRLVREAVKERNLLLQNAPHYVKPLPTTFPIFRWFSGLLNAPLKFLGWLDKPAERGALVIKIGMLLYDAYTRVHQSMPNHQFVLRRASLEQYPQLNPEIIATATYYDAAMPTPERLCIDLLVDGEAAHPRARAINYLSAVGADGTSVTLRDELSSETYSVEPRVVVNAAGPWIDFANQAIGQPTRFIGGTKGSHIVLDHPALRAAIGDHEFFFENRDGRIVLIFPLFDKVLVGTSDILIEDPDEARCTEEEIAYFFDLIRRVFPGIEVGHSHIVFQFSGVRPLPYSDAKTTGQISRDHSIEMIPLGQPHGFPVYCLVGGKWTTFRALAEQVTDRVLAQLDSDRQCSTELLAIGGGKDYPKDGEAARAHWLADLRASTGLSEERLGILFERYGTRAAEVAAFIGAGEDEALKNAPDYSHREVAYVASHEMVVHLDDFLLHRSLIGKLGQTSRRLVEELAEVIGEALGWSEARRKREIQRVAELFAELHGVSL